MRVLGGLGYKVIAAVNGVEAIALFNRTKEHVHLLVADVVMPEMGGIQLAEEALALRPGLRVLYISGYTPNAMVHRGELAAGAHMLQKPFTSELLGRTVREILDN
jgi:CheY-like chemotaxis protein